MVELNILGSLGSGAGTAITYALASFLGLGILGLIVYGIYYYMSFKIKTTVLEQTRTGYTVKQDWARQRSKKDGTNELQLMNHKGFGGEPADISYPPSEYFDTTKSGDKHIHLLQKGGDQYIPLRLSDIDEDEIQADLLEADERQRVLSSIESGYQKFKSNTWSEMIKKFANYGMVIIAAISVVLILRSASDTLGSVSSQVQEAGAQFERAIQVCAQGANQSTGGEELIQPGGTPNESEVSVPGEEVVTSG